MLPYKKILITGAKGVLGTELREQLDVYKIPYIGTDIEVDVRDFREVYHSILMSHCDVVIHCASVIDVPRCEKDRQWAYDINVTGAINVAETCRELGVFMLQVSTDYVYRGDKVYTGDGKEGNYVIGDYLDPINYYAFTKLLADVAVRTCLPYRCLVPRLSFKKKGPWPYPKAFTDQYTSRDTVDVIAKQILQALFASMFGVVHLGTERKTVYELAKRQSPDVQPISIKDITNVVLPKDTSLKLTEIPKDVL
jgi:dTDP-4-dehydrorhamnose reductase